MSDPKPCDLCGAPSQDLCYRLEGLDIVRCQSCGLVYSQGYADCDYKDLYDPGYFDERGEYFLEVQDEKVGDLAGGHIDSFQDGLQRLRKYKSNGKLLDVGCAVGIFLSLARDNGWDVQGMDVSEFAASFAREQHGLEIHTGELETIGFPDASFDVITLWDVVEHLIHPQKTLEEVHRILKDDGIILLDTPNNESLLRKVAGLIYRVSGGRITYPVSKLYHIFHLYYFSEETLRRLLDSSGFMVAEMIYKPIPREKGRGSTLERTIVTAIGILEARLHMDYELLAIARKKTA